MDMKHRLRRQLSAVINFVRFKEGKEHLYLDAMAKKQRLAAGITAAQVRQPTKKRARQIDMKTDWQNICSKNARPVVPLG